MFEDPYLPIAGSFFQKEPTFRKPREREGIVNLIIDIFQLKKLDLTTASKHKSFQFFF